MPLVESIYHYPLLTKNTAKIHENDCYMSPITTTSHKVVVWNQSCSRSMVDHLNADNM